MTNLSKSDLHRTQDGAIIIPAAALYLLLSGAVPDPVARVGLAAPLFRVNARQKKTLLRSRNVDLWDANLRTVCMRSAQAKR
mmetsp:Transcript_23697/g.61550  ORF Transcript_23697/g.61550 Transcript_23697/m.61550 type:complete len:82 (+) Transcript_23697:1395-1640(+)